MRRFVLCIGLVAFLVASFAVFSMLGDESAYAQGGGRGLALRGERVTFGQGATRSAALEARARNGARQLAEADPGLQTLRQNSFAVETETSVGGKSADGDECTSDMLFLQRDTYTARWARVTFAVNDQGKTKTRSVNANYQPPAGPTPPTVARNAQLEGEKGRGFSFQERNMRSENPPNEAIGRNQQALAHENAQPHHSWWYAKGLANTSAPEFPSAVTATQQVNSILYSALGSSALRDSYGSDSWRQSTETEIWNFLKYDNQLLAWNNIGHGVTSSSNGAPCYALVQKSGSMYYNEFSSLSPYSGLYWCVVLTNSCNSNRDPLRAHILTRYPRTYIGGNILLPVNKSEWVDVYFWYYALLRSPRLTMASALTSAQTAKGMAVGSFGINRYTGYF